MDDGFAVIEGAFSMAEVERMRAAIERIPFGREVRRKSGVYGIRNLLAISDDVQAIVPGLRRYLDRPSFAVRATFLDKVPGANWKIAWHQDSMIAVRERRDVEGFGPWAVKAGIVHVQPPAGILERMLAVRIHLDDCTRDNGALRVLPGTHRFGWIDHEAGLWRSRVPEVCCEVRAGGLLLMRPLILHASSPAATPAHRRVLHFEFASFDLPGGLEWHDRIPC
jgi:ectoine hydroxylase-related dioxygenase (phytanoyl-CoA dioxygenase family)